MGDSAHTFCPLCSSPGRPFFKDVWLECPECRGLFRPREDFPALDEEKARYEEHENDPADERYQAFVSPITACVLRHHAPGDKGLDFGSGTGPVITEVLRQNGYDIEPYDPFFCNRPELLEQQYDYIACCEVIEHFHDPASEFSRLKRLLLPGGRLYCMTALYHEGIDFQNWHYRRDDTHVFIYRRETIEWIARKYDFADVSIEERLIEFTR
jgi:SAM-dependent methyltransferase